MTFSVCFFLHGIGRSEGDAPIKEQPQAGFSWDGCRFSSRQSYPLEWISAHPVSAGGRSIICGLAGSFFPQPLMLPLMTVRLPSALLASPRRSDCSDKATEDGVDPVVHNDFSPPCRSFLQADQSSWMIGTMVIRETGWRKISAPMIR